MEAGAVTGPLDGITVLDLSAVISGPMCCQYLADQGAEVIKVEPHGIGDITRIGGFRVGTVSAMFASVNRGKRSLTLDLSKPAGVDVLKRLAASADVVVQNFRPGAVDRMGIGASDLMAVNPDLIYVSISGFGPTGPYSQGRVYDPIIQSVTGVVSIQQSRDIPIPDLVRTLICDKSTALTAAQAITAALFARARGSARGQHLEIPMLDSAMYWLWPDTFMGHTMRGPDVVPGPLLYQIYRLQPTADGHLVYFVASDAEFGGLARALGHPEWADDDRFNSPLKRQNPETFLTLGELIHNAFLEWSTDQIMARLVEHEVPSARVNTIDDAFTDPQVVHNEIVATIDDPNVGRLTLARPPVRWSHTSHEPRWSFDQLGASSEAVLADYGYDADAIAALKADGVI
jgi:crotonobetainyl-CoA:carnitine CoA-transferase CaiB-like acyl-CoA transferase